MVGHQDQKPKLNSQQRRDFSWISYFPYKISNFLKKFFNLVYCVRTELLQSFIRVNDLVEDINNATRMYIHIAEQKKASGKTKKKLELKI